MAKRKNWKSKIKKNTKEKDPITEVENWVKKNWSKLFSFYTPIFIISMILVRITYLNIIGVPISYWFNTFSFNPIAYIKEFFVCFFLFLYLIIGKVIIKCKYSKTILLFFTVGYSITYMVIHSITFNIYYFLTIFITYIFFGLIFYLQRNVFNSKMRKLSADVIAQNKKYKKFVWVIELGLSALIYIVFLASAGNLYVVTPSNFMILTGDQNKVVVLSNNSHVLATTYDIIVENGIDYILLDNNFELVGLGNETGAYTDKSLSIKLN